MTALVYKVHGRAADGVAYVSDGAIMLRADFVQPVPSTEGVREISADVIGGMLYTQPAAITRLEDLVPSRVAPAVFRTPDDVAIAERYVQLLRGIGRAVVLGTTGPRGVIVLSDGARVFGALMPVAMPPEIGTYLPPPSPGALRGRVEGLVAGLGRIGLEDGHEVAFEPGALIGLAVEMLVCSLVDADVSVDVTGRRRARWVWPAGTPRPQAALPLVTTAPVVRWPSRAAFDAVQRNGLLGEFDGGTWARAIAKLHGRTDVLDVDEVDARGVLATVYLPPGDEVTRGKRPARDGIWFVRDAKLADAASAKASVVELAAAHGVTLSDGDVADALDVREVQRALATAFARAGKKERVFLVGDRAPFLVVRETVAAQGPFMRVTEHRAPPPPGTAGSSDVFQAFADAIRANSTSLLQVASLRVDETPDAPGMTVRVLQRVFGEQPENSFFVFTDGLSARPLRSTQPGSLVRIELATWSSRHDAELARTMARLGRAVHVMAEPGSPPFHAGHSLNAQEPAWMGWSRILLARMVSGVKTEGGDVDILRVVPISDAEAEQLRAREDVLGGFGFVTELENRDFPGTLGRWYQPPR